MAGGRAGARHLRRRRACRSRWWPRPRAGAARARAARAHADRRDRRDRLEARHHARRRARHGGAARRRAATQASDDVLDWLKADLADAQADALALLEEALATAMRLGAPARVRCRGAAGSANAVAARGVCEPTAPAARRLVARARCAAVRLAPRRRAARRRCGRAMRPRAAAGRCRSRRRRCAGRPRRPASAASTSSRTGSRRAGAGELRAQRQPAASAPVVITPLARAIGRDFAAVVLPGCRRDTRSARCRTIPGCWTKRRGRRSACPIARRASGVRSSRSHNCCACRAWPCCTTAPMATSWMSAEPVGRAPAPAARRRAALTPPRRARASCRCGAWPRNRCRTRTPHRVACCPRPGAPARVRGLRAMSVPLLQPAPCWRCRSTTSSTTMPTSATAGRWLHATLERFHVARGATRRTPMPTTWPRCVAAGHDTLAALVLERQVSEEADAAVHRRMAGAGASATCAGCTMKKARAGRSTRPRCASRCRDPMASGCSLHGRIDRVDLQRRCDPGAPDRLQDRSRRSALQPRCASRSRTRSSRSMPRCRSRTTAAAARCTPATSRSTMTKPSSQVEHPDGEDSARRAGARAGPGARAHRGRRGAARARRGPGVRHCEARGLCRRDHWAEPTSRRPMSR